MINKIKSLKRNILNIVAHWMGYRNVLSEVDGFNIFVGNKYNGKGWHTVSLQVKVSRPDLIEKYFKGKIGEFVIFSQKLNKKRVKEIYI